MVTRILPQGATTANTQGAVADATPPASRERMSKVDTAWLRMDGEHNLMMIVGVWQLKTPVRLAQVQERISNTLLKYPRFHQKVTQDATGAVWEADDQFDIGHHVCKEVLPKVKGQTPEQTLKDRIGELAMQPLDPNRPLWQIHLIEDHQGGSAMIVRIHHCIADGISLIAVTMSIIDGAPPPKVHRPKGDAPSALGGGIADTVLRQLTKFSVAAIGQGGQQINNAYTALATPMSTFEKGAEGSAEMAKMAYQVVNDMAALALMPDDSPTALKGQPGNQKCVAWCDPMPIDAVKAVGKAFNCSINDVLMSCVAGAIGSYLESQGESIEGKSFRAMVPVNLRPLDQAYKLGNHFGLAPMLLPIGITSPVPRLLEIRARMTRLKNSTQPLLAFGVLAVAGVLIKPAQDALLDLFGKKASAVLTNVPGPAQKFSFCGSTIDQQMFWVPQSGKMGVGISILSYGGYVQFGVITDTQLCPNPEQLIAQFEPEFKALEWHALMLPWGVS